MSEIRADFEPHRFRTSYPYQHEDANTDPKTGGLFLAGVVLIGMVLFIVYSMSVNYFAMLNSPPPIGGVSIVPKSAVPLTIPPSEPF